MLRRLLATSALRGSAMPAVSPMETIMPPHTRGFPRDEYETRFKRAQEHMERHQLDAILVTTEESFEYFSGLSTQFWRSPTRPYYLVLPRVGSTPTAVVPSISAIPMRETWVGEVVDWPAPRPEDDGVSLVADALRRVPRTYNNIGMPMGHETSLRMPLADFFKVQESLRADGLEFKDATAAVRSVRNIKSQREVEKMRLAARRASRAFEMLPTRVAALEGDVSERDITRELRKELIRQGLDDTMYLIGESGRDGYESIVTGPTDRLVETGDVIVFDTGSRFDGYYCDFSRNFSIGKEPSPIIAGVHEMLWQATEAGIAAARPGNMVSDIFWAMARSLEEQSEGRVNVDSFSTGRFGHGLGRNLTEWPSITPYEDVEIVPGMAMAIEPGVSLMPFTGQDKVLVHEENIIVTESGAELLTKRAPRRMPVLHTGSLCTACVKASSMPGTPHDLTILNNRVLGSVGDDARAVLEDYKAQLPSAQAFHDNHPELKSTPLLPMPGLSHELNVAEILVKDEGQRLGLKAFKGLGVCYAIDQLMKDNLLAPGSTITTMTDGNHGRAVARFARENGCRAVIYVPEVMSAARRAAIVEEGGEVFEVKGAYDDSVEHMKTEAAKNGWTIISDQAWPGYTRTPLDIMVGYGTIFREVEQARKPTDRPITHVFLQAGVGGFAGAGLAYIGLSDHEAWAEDVKVVIVEPSEADAIMHNFVHRMEVDRTGELKMATGDIESTMSGLNCGVPSSVAWPLLRDLPKSFVSLGDEWAHQGMRAMYDERIIAGESGAAGVGALVGLMKDRSALQRHIVELGITSDSVVLCVNTEADTDPISFRSVIDGHASS